jgi:hypothetical protein
MASVRDLLSARKVSKAGFHHPLTTVLEARRANLPLSYAMAFLEKESDKGLNVFGHDPVKNPIKGGAVTKDRYLRYKGYRRAGLGMQGVGPMQLTWYSYQDAADALGGCWKPKFSLRIGFKVAADLIKDHGVKGGVTRWNGAGAAADAYYADWLVKQKHWHSYLSS